MFGGYNSSIFNPRLYVTIIVSVSCCSYVSGAVPKGKNIVFNLYSVICAIGIERRLYFMCQRHSQLDNTHNNNSHTVHYKTLQHHLKNILEINQGCRSFLKAQLSHTINCGFAIPFKWKAQSRRFETKSSKPISSTIPFRPFYK